jgi:hypothetical protein
MKPKDLKKLIKPIIRECLTEIFMEMNLEAIVESVIESRKPEPRQPFIPVLSEQREESPEERREKMKARLGISEDEWKSVYGDTYEDAGSNPILSGEEKPEYVPENVLRESGLMKDYSRFVK